MRKYYKLALLTVTVVSVVCLVFYKAQYDKLYNVLEVLEFFGKEPNSARGPLCDNASHSGVATFRPPAFCQIRSWSCPLLISFHLWATFSLARSSFGGSW